MSWKGNRGNAGLGGEKVPTQHRHCHEVPSGAGAAGRVPGVTAFLQERGRPGGSPALGAAENANLTRSVRGALSASVSQISSQLRGPFQWDRGGGDGPGGL